MHTSRSGRYKIGMLSRLTGLRPELLRAWQRRFGLFEPERTEGRQRLYTSDDLQLALYLRQLTEAGQSIGVIAGRGRAALLREAPPLPSELDAGRSPAAGMPTLSIVTDLGAVCDAVVQGAVAIDPGAVGSALDRGLAAATVEAFLSSVVEPASRRIGDLWARGECSVAGEHMASSLIREQLLRLLREAAPPAGRAAPEAVVACAPDDYHENGALAVAVRLARLGWRVTWLGAATPIQDLDKACRTLRPHAVYLSTTRTSGLDACRAELLAFVRRWTGAFEIIVGGQGAPDADDELTSAGARLSASWTPPNSRSDS